MAYITTISIREDARWAFELIRKNNVNVSGLITDLILEYCAENYDEWGDKPEVKVDDPEMDALDSIENELDRFHAKCRLLYARREAKNKPKPIPTESI